MAICYMARVNSHPSDWPADPQVDIKDKFRNLVKVGEITEPSSTAPKVPMTETAQGKHALGM